MKKTIWLTALLLLAGSLLPAADVIEEIYAVVNDEVITGTELKKFEEEIVRTLQSELQGEKLEQALRDVKKDLLNRFIDQKLLVSKLKEKNYDVSADVEAIIQEIKKQYNFTSDDELKEALAREGIEFAAWKEMWRARRKQERLLWDEIGSKIKVDNPQIMEYYRKNTAQFTVPVEFTLDCIYLKKNADGSRPQAKMDQISEELKTGVFDEIAKRNSELPGAGESVSLGKFKKGELDKALEEAAAKLKKGEISSWIETDNGWYIIRLADLSPEKLREVREVRDEIVQKLREAEQQVKLKDYIEQLKKDSYVKIFKEYN